MKMPIKWHEECLANMARHADDRERRLAEEAARVEKLRKAFEFCKLQLETAKKAGKDGYDGERYLVSKKGGGIL